MKSYGERHYPNEFIQYSCFYVWLKDRQIRPYFGTGENDRTCRTRSQLPYGATRSRVKSVLEVLEKADIPLDTGAITYTGNVKYQRSKPFHIKYALPTDVYVQRFCPAFGIRLHDSVSRDILTERFASRYYAERLRIIQHHREEGNATAIDPSNKLVCAPEEVLLDIGPLVLFNQPSLSCYKLADHVMDEFEKLIRDTFGDDIWYSVCLYVDKDAPVTNAQLCIGADIDLEHFADVVTMPEQTKRDFLKRYQYTDPHRQYHKELKHGRDIKYLKGT